MNNVNRSQKIDLKNRILNYKDAGRGKLVQKYNIISALIENYFISSAELKGFELARAKQDLNAHKKFGKRIYI